MEKDKQKIAAAIAAVSAYLQEEAAAAQSAMQAGASDAPYRQPAGFVRPWALNGRQTMMQIRNLMQLRSFTKL